MEINVIPKWWLDRLSIRDDFQLHIALFLSSCLALAVVPAVRHIPHICLFRTVLGFPCPGCGITSGLLSLSRLDFNGTFKGNPASILVFVVIAFQLVMRPIAMVQEAYAPKINKASDSLDRLTTLCLVAVWISRLMIGAIHGRHFLSQM